MRTLKAWSILAVGLCAIGCGTAPTTVAKSGGTAEAGPAGVSPAPAEAAPPPPARAPAFEGSEESASGADLAPHATETTASARAESGRSAGAPGKPAPRAEAKKSRPLDLEQERPGLGTTFGETMQSRVSNAPFERASGNPFSLTTIHYNDQSGIAAMLRTSTVSDFQASFAQTGNGMVTVRVLDEGGSTLPTFSTGSRTLVQGEIGQRYVIELQNSSSNRFEAVVTVDGLDVIDGRSGSPAKRGYLLQPFGSVQIDGFRQSMEEVAAFRFGSVRGSYAARKGDDRNVGVIGVALFAERGANAWTAREIGRRESADPFPNRFAQPPR